MTVEISANGLKIAYGDIVALDCPILTLRGNIISVLGHNGAGKSTFIKSILGLLPPRSGKVEAAIVEEGKRHLLQPEKHMAFCPESGSVFEDISVEDYVRLWCRIKHRDGSYYRKAGRKYLELLSLEPLLKKLGRELSKGQRRRVQTAIGFLCQPRLFLFDEPFDGLDVQKTRELADIIHDESRHMAFIVSSHRMDVMERLADAAIVLKEGHVVAAGAIDEVSYTLCKQSVLISGLSDCEFILAKLKEAFPKAAVCRIGGQISITGEEFDLPTLKKFLERYETNSSHLQSSRPTLTDAMNYHLRSMK